jgi:hypothetical protein
LELRGRKATSCLDLNIRICIIERLLDARKALSLPLALLLQDHSNTWVERVELFFYSEELSIAGVVFRHWVKSALK